MSCYLGLCICVVYRPCSIFSGACLSVCLSVSMLACDVISSDVVHPYCFTYLLVIIITCAGDDNNDIDVYTNRLETILERKMTLIRHLQGKLAVFKQHLQDEEKVSKKVAAMGKY